MDKNQGIPSLDGADEDPPAPTRTSSLHDEQVEELLRALSLNPVRDPTESPVVERRWYPRTFMDNPIQDDGRIQTETSEFLSESPHLSTSGNQCVHSQVTSDFPKHQYKNDSQPWRKSNISSLHKKLHIPDEVREYSETPETCNQHNANARHHCRPQAPLISKKWNNHSKTSKSPDISTRFKTLSVLDKPGQSPETTQNLETTFKEVNPPEFSRSSQSLKPRHRSEFPQRIRPNSRLRAISGLSEDSSGSPKRTSYGKQGETFQRREYSRHHSVKDMNTIPSGDQSEHSANIRVRGHGHGRRHVSGPCGEPVQLRRDYNNYRRPAILSESSGWKGRGSQSRTLGNAAEPVMSRRKARPQQHMSKHSTRQGHDGSPSFTQGSTGGQVQPRRDVRATYESPSHQPGGSLAFTWGSSRETDILFPRDGGRRNLYGAVNGSPLAPSRTLLSEERRSPRFFVPLISPRAYLLPALPYRGDIGTMIPCTSNGRNIPSRAVRAGAALDGPRRTLGIVERHRPPCTRVGEMPVGGLSGPLQNVTWGDLEYGLD